MSDAKFRPFGALRLSLSSSWLFPFVVESCCLVRFLVNAHQARARREANAEAYDHCRSRPFFLSRQHESGRCAGEIAEVFQHVVRLFDLGRIRIEMELRADA